MFKFWGDGSAEARQAVENITVRSTENFNWTFIFILAVVFYVYWTEVKNKNFKAIFAGFALYGVHWLYEIANAIIGHVTGYPLWSVSNASTTFILLIGVCWELSMMFSLAGIISWKMLPDDTSKRYFAKDGKKGISCKLVGASSHRTTFRTWNRKRETPSSLSNGASSPFSLLSLSPPVLSDNRIINKKPPDKGGFVICPAYQSLALIDSAWPVRPSASANLIISSASLLNALEL